MYKPITDRKGQLLLFLVLIIATFMDGFDESAVSVALPDIAAHFGVDTGDASWVVTLYFLFMAAVVLIVGKICMRGGAKKVMMAGFLSFVIGGVLAASAPSFDFLLVARSLQGVGASMLWCSVGILSVMYLPRIRLPLALASAMAGESLGCIIGPIAGGYITFHMSWEFVFLVTIPIGLLAILLVKRVIPEERFEGFDGFDFTGAVLLFISLFSGMFCIETAAYDGATMETWVMISLFLVTFVLFMLRLRRVDDPLLDIDLFRFKGFRRILPIYMIMMMCGMGLSYVNVFYLAIVMDFDTAISGTLMLIPGIVTLLVCSVSGRMVMRFGNKPFIILCCILAMMEGACYLLAGDSPLVPVVISMFLVGALWGFVDVSIGSGLVNSVSDEHRCAASATDTFVCYLSIALGCAMYFVLVTLGSNSMGIPVDELPADMFLNGFMLAVTVGVVLCVVALLISLTIRRSDINVSSEGEDEF